MTKSFDVILTDFDHTLPEIGILEFETLCGAKQGGKFVTLRYARARISLSCRALSRPPQRCVVHDYRNRDITTGILATASGLVFAQEHPNASYLRRSRFHSKNAAVRARPTPAIAPLS